MPTTTRWESTGAPEGRGLSGDGAVNADVDGDIDDNINDTSILWVSG
jgi:hypothetical protein